MLWSYNPEGLEPASFELDLGRCSASIVDTADLVGSADLDPSERWGWVIYGPDGETLAHGGEPGLSAAMRAAEAAAHA